MVFFVFRIVDQAKEIARQHALRGADAVHLASALLLVDRLADADDRLIFITSDQELKRAILSSGLEAIDPEELEKA